MTDTTPMGFLSQLFRSPAEAPPNQETLERELRKTERRLEALLEQLPYVVLYETGGGREYISDNIEQLLGYPAEMFIQDPTAFVKLIHPDDEKALGIALSQWSANGRPGVLTSQFRIRRKTGEYIWLEDQIVGVQNEDGSKSGIGVMIDVTNRRVAQQRYQAIVEAANVAGIGLGIFVERDGIPTTLYINDAAVGIGDWQLSELQGQSIYRYISPEHHKKVEEAWEVFQRGEPMRASLEMTILHKHGHLVPVSVGMSSTVLEDERAVIAFITDISERKRTEEALIAAKTEAEEISRIKSNILANFSHELRTPMHSILGFSSLIAEEIQDPELRQYARSIQRSGQRLLSTLTSIIEVAALESNPGEIVLYPILLPELLREEVENFKPVVEEKGISLHVEILADDLVSLLDKDRFRKAMDKILNNALKFTYQGSITVQLSTEVRDTRKGRSGERAVIRVRDTGVGMSQEFLSTAFDKFKQESDGFNRAFEGTGLGLTLARGYLHLMNGDISLTSEPGQGTEVVITFPIVSRHSN